MAVFRQLAPDGTGRSICVHSIPAGGLVIGRGEGAGLFLDDLSVSRTHVQLVRHERGWLAVALSEANPVKVNGQPITSAVLCEGDLMTLGSVQLQFLEHDPRAQPTIIGAEASRGPARPPAPPSPSAPAVVHAPAPGRAPVAPPPRPLSAPQPPPPPPPPTKAKPSGRAGRRRGAELGAHERVGFERPGFFARNGREMLASVAVVGLGAAGVWWMQTYRPLWMASIGWEQPWGSKHVPSATAPPEPGKAPAPDAQPSPQVDARPPAEPNPAAPEDAAAFEQVVATEQGVTFARGGIRLEAPAGAFPVGTTLQVRSRSDIKAIQGLTLLTAPVEVETGGVQPRGDVVVRIPYDGTGLPEGDRPVVVSPRGSKLHEVPSYFDRKNGVIVARADHFSILAAVGWATLKASGVAVAVVMTVYAGGELGAATKGEWVSLYPGEYVTRGGVTVRYDPKHPDLVAGSGSGHPQYVLDAGAAFDEALRDLASMRPLKPMRVTAEELPTVVVVHRAENRPTGAEADLPWGSAVMAATAPSLATIAIEFGLGPRLLRETAIHETSHVWQIQQVGWRASRDAGWWREASSEWVGWTAHPAFTRAGNAGQFSGMDHLDKGFLGEVGLNEAYNLGDFAVYIDRLCPGIIADSWKRSGFVANGTSWYAGLSALLQRKCGAELETVLSEYLLLHGLPAGTPRGPGTVSSLPSMFGPGKYARLRESLPAVSMTVTGLRTTAVDAPYTLITRDAGSSAHHRLRFGAMPATGPKVAVPAQGHEATGRVYSRTSFGGLRAKAPGFANVVHVVSANPTDAAVRTNVEVYLLSPPTALTGLAKDAGGKTRVTLRWSPPPLARGTKSSDAGALAKIRVYQRTGAGVRKVADVDAANTAWEGELEVHWVKDRTTLFTRAVDKYGNESEDSAPVQLRRSARPKPKAKPKPRVKPRPKPPQDRCASCPINGPACAPNKAGKTRCWKMNCCE